MTFKGRRLLRLLRHPGDLLLFLRILLFAAAVPILFRLKMTAVQAVIEPREILPAPDRVDQIVRYTDLALHHGWPAVRRSCLVRGTTLYYFLRRAGLDVALWFGVGYVDGKLAGHCWLMKDGEPYLEGKDPQ